MSWRLCMVFPESCSRCFSNSVSDSFGRGLPRRLPSSCSQSATSSLGSLLLSGSCLMSELPCSVPGSLARWWQLGHFPSHDDYIAVVDIAARQAVERCPEVRQKLPFTSRWIGTDFPTEV